MTYTENFQKWLDFEQLPDYLRQELLSMDEKTKEDALYTNLEFGTARMRGYIGAGTNPINIYVVRQATEGLAKLIETKGEEAKKRGVAIAYDSRHFSPEFAFESAQVLAQHGIKSYVFEALRPTPELSFAVRHLNAYAGIMVTASHNPAPFNGYKVYGQDVYTALIAFMGPWMDFIFAKVILGDATSKYTVAIGLFSMLQQDTINQWFMSFTAGSVIIAIPITILFMFMQKYYVEGITGGSVK